MDLCDDDEPVPVLLEHAPAPATLSLDGDDSKEPATILLIGKDECKVLVPRTACQWSSLITSALEDPECKSLTFKDIPEEILTRIVSWMVYHEKVPPREIAAPLVDNDMKTKVDQFDYDLCFPWCNKENFPHLFDFIVFSNYLGIEPLRTMGCAFLAATVKATTVAEIRNLLGLAELPVTKEEEELVAKEYEEFQ